MSYRKPTVTFLPVLLLTALTACSPQSSSPANSSPEPALAVAASANADATVEAPNKATGLDIDALRDAASAALRENRMYAPAGNNAIEYYLALRDQSPDDSYVGSALVDLLPFTLTAAENQINRENLAEANRLISLIEKINTQAPALPRLKQSLASSEARIAQRSQAEAERLKRDADNRLRQQAEQQRLAQQQATEAEAARALASQQEAARRAAAQQETERQQAQARQEEESRLAAVRQQTARTAATNLKAISTPAPRYPADALRARTSGEVMMELTIGTDGSVTNARVLRSEPARVFDREALSAVRRWKYEPIETPTTIRRTMAFKPE